MKRLIYLLIVLSLALQASFAQINQQDSLALVALYNSTNGANWVNNTNWLTGPVGTWFGITVDTNNRVTAINLPNNGLKGTIPSAIGNLTALKKLVLSDEDSLYGPIPSSIGNLIQLEELYLNNNYLSGQIPPSIGNLLKLHYLYLQNNKLTGTIPQSIGNLEMLVVLYLANNELTDTIPSSIGNLGSLKYLYLYNNRLTGHLPQSIGNLTSLVHLFVQENYLSGPLPASIGNLSNLQILYLYQNSFSGQLPQTIQNLTSLTTLNVSHNNFQGEFPDIRQLINLTTLDISYNHFNQLIDLSAMESLSSFKIAYNNFTFEDIEPNIGMLTLYSPQYKVGQPQYITPSANQTVHLSIIIPGQHNQYQWYKSGSPISGATDSVYEIANYDPENDAGVYYCKITDTLVPNLTLKTFNYYVGFSVPGYTISASVQPQNAGTVTGTGTYPIDYPVTLTATPEYGYYFAYWTENGQIVFADSAYSFNVDSNRTLTAVFRPKAFKISLNVYPEGCGLVSGAGFYPYLDTITVSAQPADNYVFCCWTNGTDTVSTDNPFTFTVTGNITLTANFKSVTANIEQVSDLWIYPNPASGFITISSVSGASKAQILNQSGKVVKTLIINGNQRTINLKNLPSGVYFIRVFSDKTAHTAKFIKL